MCYHDGAPLPEGLHERLLRECERLALVEKQAADRDTCRTNQVDNTQRRRVAPGIMVSPGQFGSATHGHTIANQ